MLLGVFFLRALLVGKICVPSWVLEKVGMMLMFGQSAEGESDGAHCRAREGDERDLCWCCWIFWYVEDEQAALG